jgi:hypothetical protein
MGEEFYCILKLVSGEEILSLIMVDENDGDPIIVLQNPITMKSYHNHHGTHIKVKSWMELASDDFFMIKMDKIITMTETKDKKLIEIYNEFIKDDDTLESYTLGGSVKPSTKMGYISSVEDARSNLEKIFKGFKES